MTRCRRARVGARHREVPAERDADLRVGVLRMPGRAGRVGDRQDRQIDGEVGAIAAAVGEVGTPAVRDEVDDPQSPAAAALERGLIQKKVAATRAEREQLAADLRLIVPRDETNIDLLDEGVNQ